MIKITGSIRHLVAAAALGWIAGISLVLVSPESAFATAPDCSAHENVEASTWNDSSLWVNTKGMNVYPGDYIGTPPTPTCFRVASIVVIKDNQNMAEVGWEIDSDNLVGFCNHGIAAGTPYRLVIIFTGGTHTCYPSGIPPEVTGLQQFHQVEVNDPNVNGSWDYYWNSSIVHTFFASFSKGAPITNGERYGEYDGVFSDFDGLQYNMSGTFGAWTNRHCYVDDNPDAKNVYPFGEKDHMKVENTAGSCPSGD